MLGEIAITPDVLAEGTHLDEVAVEVYIQMLKEPLLQEVLVRNLRDGAWYRDLLSPDRALSPRGKELLKKLHTQKRLRLMPDCGTLAPGNDADWCQEALDSHETDALDCVVATSDTKQSFQAHTLVTNLERICSHAWWSGRTCSVRLRRTMDDYLKHLDRLLKCSNSLMFIDPHFDPQENRYADFWRLLERASRTVAPPRIEIHRVCRKRDSHEPGGWRLVPESEWRETFATGLKAQLSGLSLCVEVFIWDDFHDRYLISNLMGILIPNGFDVDSTGSLTTWTRLGRGTSDEIQLEFDPENSLKPSAASKPQDNSPKRHILKHRFTLFP